MNKGGKYTTEIGNWYFHQMFSQCDIGMIVVGIITDTTTDRCSKGKKTISRGNFRGSLGLSIISIFFRISSCPIRVHVLLRWHRGLLYIMWYQHVWDGFSPLTIFFCRRCPQSCDASLRLWDFELFIFSQLQSFYHYSPLEEYQIISEKWVCV